MMKAEIHRILQNPIYVGDFRGWDGNKYQARMSRWSRESFQHVQAVPRHKPRARHLKQQHAFMGLLTCARCGCAMTAERKKGKYVYYRCTGYHGGCDNTYIREEQLSDLFGTSSSRFRSRRRSPRISPQLFGRRTGRPISVVPKASSSSNSGVERS